MRYQSSTPGVAMSTMHGFTVELTPKQLVKSTFDNIIY